MSALRLSAKQFVPVQYSEEQEEEPEYNEYQDEEKQYDYVSFDDIIRPILESLDTPGQYYIKGGKAYNYYYPHGYVPSSDYDLVATNGLCNSLFESLTTKLSSLEWPLWVDGEDLFYIHNQSIKKTAPRTYNDVNIFGENVKNTVRSLTVNNGQKNITLVDVIIPDNHDSILAESEHGKDGLWYMEKSLFDKDVHLTYNDRVKMLNLINRNPSNKPDFIRKKASVEHKLSKSEQRYLTSIMKQGRMKRKSARKSSRKSRKCKCKCKCKRNAKRS